MNGLSPRERVLTALARQQPDRTPCDFWAEPPTWNRLLTHVGYADRDRLLDELAVDVRHLDAPGPPEQPLGEGQFQNFWGERYVYRPTAWGPMREDVKGALAEAQTWAELEAFAWPSPDCLDRSGLAAQCRRGDAHALRLRLGLRSQRGRRLAALATFRDQQSLARRKTLSCRDAETPAVVSCFVRNGRSLPRFRRLWVSTNTRGF